MKILVFGGTFDPVHLGHEEIFRDARKIVKPNLSIIIPSKNPPLKIAEPCANAEQRMAMAKIVFEKYRNTIVSPIEILNKKNTPSYTIDTIKKLKLKYKNSKIYLLIGGDRYLDFSKWKKHEELLKNLEKVIVFNRNNQKINANKIFYFLNKSEIKISSNTLRNNLDKRYLDRKVYEYIFKNGLYLKNFLKNFVNKERVGHSVRVANLAVKLAKLHDKKNTKKAFIAGMLHDICKEFSKNDIEKIVGIKGGKYPNTHTKHGIAASIYLKKIVGIKDKDILTAIENHVIPKEKSNLLTKIIYCADKLDPNKNDVNDQKKYLSLATKNIDIAFLKLSKEIKSRYV